MFACFVLMDTLCTNALSKVLMLRTSPEGLHPAQRSTVTTQSTCCACACYVCVFSTAQKARLWKQKHRDVCSLQRCGWMDGWVFFCVEGVGTVLWYPSHPCADTRHPLVYIHRIGSALHTNKILLLIISAPQTSANQSDQHHQAGWVARAPWVPNMFFFPLINEINVATNPCWCCDLCRPPADDCQLHWHGGIHHPVWVDYRRVGLLSRAWSDAVCGWTPLPHGR